MVRSLHSPHAELPMLMSLALFTTLAALLAVGAFELTHRRSS